MKSVKAFESLPPYSSPESLFHGENKVSKSKLIEKKLNTNQSKFLETLL
jgi:hypothetical protein